jgi:two-component system response regulator AtoC
MVIAEASQLSAEHFKFEQTRERPTAHYSDIYDGLSLKRAQQIVEKDLITRALHETDGNRTRAARLLEISHPSLLSKMKAYEIDL